MGRTYIPSDMETTATVTVKGRPREFCMDEALAAALRVFWRHGYEGASMTELTEAMGITRPSLYAAFGNKESLFHKALDLYEAEKLEYTRAGLEEPTAPKVAEYMLRGALAVQTCEWEPKGCMGVVSSVACGAEAASIKADIAVRWASSKAALAERFERAQMEGDLPAHVDPAGLTNYLYALMQGMAVQASAGASPAELQKLVETGLALWPSA